MFFLSKKFAKIPEELIIRVQFPHENCQWTDCRNCNRNGLLAEPSPCSFPRAVCMTMTVLLLQKCDENSSKGRSKWAERNLEILFLHLIRESGPCIVQPTVRNGDQFSQNQTGPQVWKGLSLKTNDYCSLWAWLGSQQCYQFLSGAMF